MLKKRDNNHIEGPIDGQNERHAVTGQEKFQPLPEKKLQKICGAGPIEIRIYEDEVSDRGQMMLKISFAKQEIRRFTRR
jgi:hypothetical protein